MTHVLAIDQGTTKTKCFTLQSSGEFEHVLSLDHRQMYPQAGWVEHDPVELLDNVRRCIEAAGDVSAVGLANQGETVIAWDRKTGEPIHNAIVWQDQRTQEFIDRLKADGAEQLTLELAGLPLDPYFSASKLRWIVDNVPAAKRLFDQDRLGLGTSETFFLDRLAGVYVTDVTTASRTSLMNLETLKWDAELCNLFGVPREILPQIRSTTDDFGSVKSGSGETPIRASVVDQQAALFGHRCFKSGQAKVTFGTGAFALANAGHSLRRLPDSGILTTVAWKMDDRKPVYAVDAGMYNAASAVDWLVKAGIISGIEEVGSLSGNPASLEGVFFVPALSGLACPHWDRNAAGLWIGLGLETTKEVLVKSVLEGVAFRAAELVSTLWELTGESTAISIDGGLANNRYFCQVFADALGKEVRIPEVREITALGTAYLAMIGAGRAASEEELPEASGEQTIIEPLRDLNEQVKKFRDAVSRAGNWR